MSELCNNYQKGFDHEVQMLNALHTCRIYGF